MKPNNITLKNQRDSLKDIKQIVFALFCIFVIFRFILVVGYVNGSSMAPTYQDHTVFLGLRHQAPNRGDVVLVGTEQFGNIIKRVIAIPGDTISIVNGVTYLNGEVLDEPYVEYTSDDNYAEAVVPEGCYFIMGDNRPNSSDSRNILSFIEQNDIIGIVLIHN